MKSEASHGEFFFASSGIHQPIQVYTAWILKRSSLVTSGTFCYFIVEPFHMETCGVWQGGQVTLLRPGLPAFLGFSLGQRVEILLRYFLPVLSRALPKNQRRTTRRWGDDTAMVSKGTTLAATEDTPSLTGRRGEILAEVKGKTLWVWDFINHSLGATAEQGSQGWLSTARKDSVPS